MKPELSNFDFACLQLSRSENVGKSTFFRLIEIFKTPQKALEHLQSLANQGGLARKIKICSRGEVENELVKTAKFGAKIINFYQEEYPYLLKNIAEAPPIITIKGNLELLKSPTIAIVGPRNASFNGIAVAKKIAIDLGQHSIVTVSGMARGVDSAAHEASILSGTVGVIAGGIDNIYPSENAKLYENVAKHGLLVSENPFNALPKGGNFVQRNRIISGLSYAVIVVEAGIKSGSLITAKYAAEQGREVFSIPGSPFDARCRGTNRLIKEGANMFESIEDVLIEMPNLQRRFGFAGKLSEPEFAEFAAPEIKLASDNEIAEIKQEILEKLNFSTIALQDIIDFMQIPTPLLNIALVELELAGKIEVSLGKVMLKID
jgi:DNA processing protein